MKVYVSELPKSCSECEWFTPNHCSKNVRNFCLLERMPFCNTQEERQTIRGQHKDSLSDFDCPLHSIADHTKQVRKEVCEEIFRAFNRKIDDEFGDNDTKYITLDVEDVNFYLKDLVERIGEEK